MGGMLQDADSTRVHDSVASTLAFPHKVWLGIAWTGLTYHILFPISGMLLHRGYNRQSLQGVRNWFLTEREIVRCGYGTFENILKGFTYASLTPPIHHYRKHHGCATQKCGRTPSKHCALGRTTYTAHWSRSLPATTTTTNPQIGKERREIRKKT